MLKKIQENQDFSEVLKKGIVALLIRVMGFLAGYIFIYYTVKFFGAETQGRLALSFSFMIIGSLFCRLGIDISLVKVFAIEGNLDNAKGVYFKLLPYILALSVLVSLLVFYFSPTISVLFFDDPELNVYLQWTAPCIVFYTFILINAAVFRGLRKNTLYSFLFNGGRFVFTLLFFGALLFGIKKDPVYAVIAHSLAIFGLFAMSFYYIYKFIFPRVKTSKYRSKTFVVQSLPMLFAGSMIVFLGWSDTIILGVFRDSSVVGMYSVVLKVAAVTSFTFQAIDSILAPKLSKAFHNDDMALFKRLVKFSTLINLGVSVVVVFGIILFKGFILGIFGTEFYMASTALIILCVGQLFNAICGPVGSILQMTGHQKVFQNILFIALIINISLNLLLVKKYGINGVATATAVSLAFWNVTSVVYIKRVIFIK
ncbi:flippase [Formosa sp. S-31]|uniref:flippase n=1 Tax=Formosa sp. S-31 TaxID=2790949 RepID=UPI003EBE722E